MNSRLNTVTAVNTNFQRCLDIISRAKSDDEKLASLHIAGNLLQADTCSLEYRKKIFDAIGFQFLNRLLRTKTPAHGCTEWSYKSMALSILASFCTDTSLCVKPDMLSNLVQFNTIITSIAGSASVVEEEVVLVKETYDCLTCIASQVVGLKAFVQYKTVTALSQAITEHRLGWERAQELLLYTVKELDINTWDGNIVGLQTFLMYQSSLIAAYKAKDLVQLFGTMTIALSSVDSRWLVELNSDIWSRRLHNALFLALKSKLCSEYREAALILSSTMIDLFGVQWTLTATIETGDCKFLLILVHLCCIEIRIILEECDIDKVTHSATLICGCYKILENVISYMTNGPSLCLHESQTRQLHSAMTGAFTAVLYFLKYIECDAPAQQSSAIVTATVRVLGSWIAEETLALQEHVISALPFLLTLSKIQFETEKAPARASDSAAAAEVDRHEGTLHFLLPGLCHLSADETARKVMIDGAAHHLLVNYFIYTYQHLHASSTNQALQTQLEVSLTTLCGVLLNFAVTEIELVSTDAHFSELLSFLILQFPELEAAGSHVVLLFNMCVLAIMLVRHRRLQIDLRSTQCSRLLSSAVALLHCHVLCASSGIDDTCFLAVKAQYREHWDDVSDLWLLTMQVLCALMPVCDELVIVMLASGCIPSTINTLLKAQGRQVSDVTRDSYAMVLCQLASLPQPHCKRLVLQSGAKELAAMYGMSSLSDALS